MTEPLDIVALARAGSLLTAAEAAARFVVQPSTVRQWASRYELRRFEWDGRTYYLESDLADCDRDRRRSGRARRRAVATHRPQ